MSDAEILQRWNNALDKRAHVEILADLNAVGEPEMREKLVELGAEGLPEPKKRRKRAERAPAPRKMDELRAMALYNEGLCDFDIAEALGVSKPSVCKWRNMMRLKPNPQTKRRTTLRDEDAMELWKAGLCDLDIAERLGVSKNTVADWRKRKGLECNRQRPGVEECPATEEKRREERGGTALLGRKSPPRPSGTGRGIPRLKMRGMWKRETCWA